MLSLSDKMVLNIPGELIFKTYYLLYYINLNRILSIPIY